MRRIKRLDLSARTQRALNRRQADADTRRASGTLNVEKVWKAARKTKPLKTALGVLQEMAGQRHRCMYCGDSHGTDMEHFWPKSPYPDRMFCWPNLLLCCTECGRFKGDQFPLENGTPLLVDPTVDDPWQFLDFDPLTGNIVPRFDPLANEWTPKGTKTVAVLQLSCREALAASYQKTHRRLRSLVKAALQDALPDARALADALREADDHGLLGWCLNGTGQDAPPFSDLRQKHPAVWITCAKTDLTSS
jgi:uncharacterized protein (TIGR02646 family)